MTKTFYTIISILIITISIIIGGLMPYIILCVYKYSLVTDFGQLGPIGRVHLFVLSIFCSVLGFFIGLIIKTFIPEEY